MFYAFFGCFAFRLFHNYIVIIIVFLLLLCLCDLTRCVRFVFVFVLSYFSPV